MFVLSINFAILEIWNLLTELKNHIFNIHRDLMKECLAQMLIILSLSLLGTLVWFLLYFYSFFSHSLPLSFSDVSLSIFFCFSFFCFFVCNTYQSDKSRMSSLLGLRNTASYFSLSLSLSHTHTHTISLQCSSYGAVTSVSASQVLNSISQSLLHTYTQTHARTHSSLIVISTGLIVIYTPPNPRRKK